MERDALMALISADVYAACMLIRMRAAQSDLHACVQHKVICTQLLQCIRHSQKPY